MSQCKIYLENYGGVYYAGSEIRGRIECYFDDEVTIRGIKLRIQGREYNSWSGTETYTENNRTETRTVELIGENNFLNVEQLLFGSGTGTQTVARGRHVYPFSYHLSYDLPSTFKGPHGSISYKVKAVVDRPMRVDYEDDFIFVLQSPIDFNHVSRDLQNPRTYTDSKTVCCWCCRGGDVTMEIHLPKRAFVPGEIVPFTVTITNLSNSTVDDLKIKFLKTVTYKVTTPSHETKTDVDKILTIDEHGVGAHGEHTYNLQLVIPGYIEVPNFKKCQLFKVSYELQFSAEMSGCTMDLDMTISDITMGHIQHVNQAVPNPGFQVPAHAAYPVPVNPPYNPHANPSAPPGAYPTGSSTNFPYPSNSIYPSNSPSAPLLPDDPKAREAAINMSQGPNSVPDMPPPSYNDVVPMGKS